MRIVHDIAPLRALLGSEYSAGVGLVPTMGNLHDGHLALVRACRAACDACVVSIFVNPTQFAPGEDFASYPRTLDEDLGRLDAEGVDVVFNPSLAVMYPDGQRQVTTITVPSLANTLCGASRPGHFDGVATVVAKLFNIVAPARAFFGEKDWQQLTLIRAMARQLDMPVIVDGVPTVRAANGLALSSRNGYLVDAERRRAALIYQTLTAMRTAIEAGERDYAAAEARAQRALADAGFKVDYVAVRDASRLVKPGAASTQLRLLVAARIGAARLIDNVGVDL